MEPFESYGGGYLDEKVIICTVWRLAVTWRCNVCLLMCYIGAGGQVKMINFETHTLIVTKNCPSVVPKFYLHTPHAQH